MRTIALFAAILLLPSVLLAQDGPKADETFVSLFDGKTAALLINGKRAWKIDDLTPATGLIGLQCEVPGGGQFLIRDIRISER